MRLALAAFAAVALLCSAAHAQNQVGVQATISSSTCLGTGKMSAQESGCLVLDLPLASSVGIQIGTGWQGNMCFEGTLDNVTWYSLNAFPQPGGLPTNCTTTPGIWDVDPRGAWRVRVRASALDSGNVPVAMQSQIEAPPATVISVSGVSPTGMAIPFAASQRGEQYVTSTAPPLNPLLPRCNPVRTTQCQP